MTITIHATFKKYANGYLPMLTLRAAKGRMIGCKCPEGVAREFMTFLTPVAAKAEGERIARRMAAQYPAILRAA